jgi:hypothetical protein
VKELYDAEGAATGNRRSEAPEAGEQSVVINTELASPSLTIERNMGGTRLDDAESAARTHLEP